MSVLDRLIPYTSLRVLISGGAAGIGEVLAAAYMEAGAKVHVCDVSEAALAAFRDRYPDSVATRADVGDPAQILPPDRHDDIWAIQRELDFAGTVYGTGPGTSMRELMRRQSEFYGAHADDTVIDGS